VALVRLEAAMPPQQVIGNRCGVVAKAEVDTEPA